MSASWWRERHRIVLGAVAATAIGALVVPVTPRAEAATAATLAAGLLEPQAGRTGIIVNSWGFKRLGTYTVSIDGNPARAVSVAMSGRDRHRVPAADSLSLKANTVNSPVFDYVLWKYGTSNDPIVAAALNIVAWHLAPPAQVTGGSPQMGVSGPSTPEWGPVGGGQPGFAIRKAMVPTNAATGAPVALGGEYPTTLELSDAVEATARNMVAEAQAYQGPWTVRVGLEWGSFVGSVIVRGPTNQPAGGVTVNLSSPNAVVPVSVVTGPSGVANFVYTPNGPQTAITATVSGPGVHKEYDADDINPGGFQRIAVAQSVVSTATYTAQEPVISTYAKDADDGDKSVGAGGRITDTVSYENLLPGGTYTAKVVWQNKDTTIPTSLTDTVTFTASDTGDGQIDVGPLTLTAAEAGHTLVAFQYLYRGTDTNAFPVLTHEDIDDADQTLVVQTPLIVSVARDLLDGDHTAYVGGRISNTVSYINLAPGVEFTVLTEWHLTDGTNDLGASGLTSTTTFTADASGLGTVDTDPVVLTAAESGQKLVAFDYIYTGTGTTGTPIASHVNPSDPQQQINVPRPGLTTLARDTADNDKTVIALGRVSDQLTYTNLHPGVTYTTQLEWRFTEGINDLGPTGLTATVTFTPTSPVGSIVVGPTSLSATVSGTTLVGFQRLYLGTSATGTPVAVHEQPDEFAQQIIVLPQTITTTATEGTAEGVAIPGDHEVIADTGATIVDTAQDSALTPGMTVSVEAALVRYDEGECSEAVTTVTAEVVVTLGGIVVVVHAVPEAPGEYVAYVVVKDLEGEVLTEHQDCTAESQRITVVTGDMPATF